MPTPGGSQEGRMSASSLQVMPDVLNEAVMNAFRQIVSILTAAGLVLGGSPVSVLAADGGAMTTECGTAASCTSAYAAAVTRCTTAGGASLGMVGPCSDSASQ